MKLFDDKQQNKETKENAKKFIEGLERALNDDKSVVLAAVS